MVLQASQKSVIYPAKTGFFINISMFTINHNLTLQQCFQN